MKLMIVDDEEADVIILKSILHRAGYTQFAALRDPREVVKRFHACRPDLLLLDLHMPHMDGFEVMAALKELVPEDEYLPILVLTADARLETKRRALSSGARDFINKPFEAEEVRLRIRNLLEARRFHLELREQNEGSGAQEELGG